MHTSTHTLRQLAQRVGRGDQDAAERLSRELQPHLVRIANRALRASSAPTRLTRQVRLAAGKLANLAGDLASGNSEGIIGATARTLCESLVHRLQAGTPPPLQMLETVRI